MAKPKLRDTVVRTLKIMAALLAYMVVMHRDDDTNLWIRIPVAEACVVILASLTYLVRLVRETRAGPPSPGP